MSYAASIADRGTVSVMLAVHGARGSNGSPLYLTVTPPEGKAFLSPFIVQRDLVSGEGTEDRIVHTVGDRLTVMIPTGLIRRPTPLSMRTNVSVPGPDGKATDDDVWSISRDDCDYGATWTTLRLSRTPVADSRPMTIKR